MTTSVLTHPETTAAATPRAAVVPASPACCAAWDLFKASLRMGIAAQLPEATAIHYATAAAAARLAGSLARPEPPAA